MAVEAQPQVVAHLGHPSQQQLQLLLLAAAAASAAADALAAASWASFAALAAASLATAVLVLGVFAPLGVWSVLFFFLPGLGADFLVLFL